MPAKPPGKGSDRPRSPRVAKASWSHLHQIAAAAPDDPRWELLRRRCELLIRSRLAWRIRARQRAGAGDTVEDVAQEVMLRLFDRSRRGADSFTGRRAESLDAYIGRIAANLIVDEYRRSRRQSAAGEDLVPTDPVRLDRQVHQAEDGSDGLFGPERAVWEREKLDAIHRALEQLSADPRQRQLNRRLFQLYFLDGISIMEISRLRSVPLSASSVSRRVRNIRNVLRLLFPVTGPGMRRSVRETAARAPAPRRSPEPGPAARGKRRSRARAAGPISVPGGCWTRGPIARRVPGRRRPGR